MAEIDGFNSIVSTLVLAKTLYDNDRFDIVEEHFFDALCWDDYYHNICSVISLIFSRYEGDYMEDDATEIMYFGDDVISNYFVNAWDYGKKHNLHYSQNPYVELAHKEVSSWLGVSTCSGAKLCAYVRSEKSAKKSIIVVYSSNCSCNSHEGIAYGLIQLYSWFVAKNAEFDTMKHDPNAIGLTTSVAGTEESAQGAIAA